MPEGSSSWWQPTRLPLVWLSLVGDLTGSLVEGNVYRYEDHVLEPNVIQYRRMLTRTGASVLHVQVAQGSLFRGATPGYAYQPRACRSTVYRGTTGTGGSVCGRRLTRRRVAALARRACRA